MKHELDLMLELQLEGNHIEARKLSNKLEAVGPDKILDGHGNNTTDIWMRHCFNRGWFMIQDGDYKKGCELLENGRFLSVYGSPPLMTQAPLFNPEKDKIKGKSIIISLEGGYGDEIIHARFAKSFKKLGAKHVYIACAPELVDVFSRIKGVDKVILRNQANTVAHDYWAPGFSAGWLSGNTFENFESEPYLAPLPELVESWKETIKSDKIKIGIRWAGNPKFEHQQFRRFPENFITNLTQYPELKLFSLQKDHNTMPLDADIIDLQHVLLTWDDTMAVIANLDLVITSCTAIAHLSAAMGKETWVIVPALPYHTWTCGSPENTGSPYYKNIRLFRQSIYGKWNKPWQNVYAALEEKFNLKHIDLPDEDRIDKKLNLGCGLMKIKGYNNVDKSSLVKPDEIVDLDITPWPWKDNEYTHLIAKDILEHLGENNKDLINIIKEMYRISCNGATWEIQVPHWRSDTALDDPTHKRLITRQFFSMFDKQENLNTIKRGGTESLIAFDNNVDIQVVDVQFIYTDPWRKKIQQREINDEELSYALNHFNNVALAMVVLIQVFKPGRIDNKEVNDEIEKLIDTEIDLSIDKPMVINAEYLDSTNKPAVIDSKHLDSIQL